MTTWPALPLPRQPAPTLREHWVASGEAPTDPEISVVIVHHSLPWSTFSACLEAIGRGRALVRCQVIVVDHGLTPDVLDELITRFTWVEVVPDHSDRGYAVSNNLGLRRAAGRYLLLLNDDVVLPASALRAMIDWMDAHPGAGYAGPRLVLPDGRLDRACRRAFPTPLVSLYRLAGLAWLFPGSRSFGRYNLSYLPVDQTVSVDAVVGACMLVRRAAAARVGLLDETYFMYGEDLDWALRLRQDGWQGWYLAFAVALHLKGSSSKLRRLRTTYEFYRAMVVFYRRHYAATAPWAVTWLVFTGVMWRGSVALFYAWLGGLPKDRTGR